MRAPIKKVANNTLARSESLISSSSIGAPVNNFDFDMLNCWTTNTIDSWFTILLSHKILKEMWLLEKTIPFDLDKKLKNLLRSQWPLSMKDANAMNLIKKTCQIESLKKIIQKAESALLKAFKKIFF